MRVNDEHREEIKRRHESGETLKHIGESMGFARSTVWAVVNEWHRNGTPVPRVKRTRVEKEVAPRWCPGCGGIINVIPCRLCAVRAGVQDERGVA